MENRAKSNESVKGVWNENYFYYNRITPHNH